MSTIWRYTLYRDGQTLAIPFGASFLSCRQNGNSVDLWFLIENKNAVIEARFFRLVKTGDTLNCSRTTLTYLGSAISIGDVTHVFEEEVYH